jgi:hypothetical protein
VAALDKVSSGYARGGYQTERWRPVVERFFNSEDVPWALAIIDCASGGDPDLITGEKPGVFQKDLRQGGLFQHTLHVWVYEFVFVCALIKELVKVMIPLYLNKKLIVSLFIIIIFITLTR